MKAKRDRRVEPSFLKATPREISTHFPSQRKRKSSPSPQLHPGECSVHCLRVSPENPSGLHSCNSRGNVLSGQGQACYSFAHTPGLVSSRENNLWSMLLSQCKASQVSSWETNILKRTKEQTEPGLLAAGEEGLAPAGSPGTLGMPLALLCWETWDLMRASFSSPNILKIY